MDTQIRDLGIIIAGVDVTSDNCSNITGPGISGSISYDLETKTLTLNNAIIEGSIWFCNWVKDITINLIGSNTVTSSILSVRGTKMINGSGKLRIVDIICSSETTTIIEDCTIEVDTSIGNWDWAIIGSDQTSLTTINANISTKANQVAIGGFANIKLVGCKVVEPVDAYILTKLFEGTYRGRFICHEDGTIAKKVVIKK